MKFFLDSKTIRGLIIAALPLLGIGTEDQVLVTQTVDTLITLAGLLFAGYGRAKAEGKLKFNPFK